MLDIYIYLGLYITLLLIISYFISRKQNEEDFLISGRDRGGWQIMASKFAAAIGAGYFITYTGFAYEYGLGVFAMLFGMLAGYLLFGYWAAPKIHAHSKENKFYTMGDFVYNKTKSFFSLKLTNVLSNLILFLWLLVGIIGGAKIISDFGLMSYSIAVLLTVFVILVYIYLAGFKAVIITDFIQAIIILGLLFLVTFSIIGSGSLSEVLSVQTGDIDIGTAIGFFLFGLLAIFSYSNMFQLCYAAKTKNKLKHGIGLAVVPILITGFFLLVIGMFMASQVSGLDSGLVFTEALKNFLPAYLLPLGIVLFFAGIMSSADTNVYAISSHLIMNRKNKTTIPVTLIRITMILLMIVTTMIALIFTDIVDVSIIAGGLSLTLSLPIIYLISNGRNSNRFIGSAIGGLIGLVGGIAVLGIEPVIALVVLISAGLGLLWNFKLGRNDNSILHQRL
jgi:solute:Na+ symporter, SSS family